MDFVKFKVNGVECMVGRETSSDVTLVQYIRKTLNLPGTKFMCTEGGCGVCIVQVRKHPNGLLQPINSCLVSITSCHGWEIFTIESLGDKLNGYDPISESLAKNNGTQCGYCTSGWVMAMKCLLANGKTPTMADIEKSFGSNICRCTGYRPIIEAFKKFGSDAPESDRITDIEDLKICKKTGASCNKTNCDEDDSWCILSKEEVERPPILSIKLKDDKFFYKVYTCESIFKIWKKHGGQTYMLVHGNTGKGVTPIEDYPTVIIDVQCVEEMKGHTRGQNLCIGAGHTIAEALAIFEAQATESDFEYLEKFVEHIEVVASVPTKDHATIGGNLAMKNSNHEFASDLYLILETVGAYVTVRSRNKTETMSMQDFLDIDLENKIIMGICLPPLSSQYKMMTFKVMPRSQSAPAIVNAGFRYQLCDNNVVKDARIVYGGVSASFIRASTTEQYLIGKPLYTNDTLQGALDVLQSEIVVTTGYDKASVSYRTMLVCSLFYKGLLSLCPVDIIDPKYVSGRGKIHSSRPVSSSTRSYESDKEKWPLYEPMPKVEALIQCTGEARYTEDMPRQPREMAISYVLSTVAVGELGAIDASAALALEGVIAFYSAADIPGTNSFTPGGSAFFNSDEEVFASTKVSYMYQPIGMVVAETQHIADKAAKLVTATYTNVTDPVIDIKVAKADTERISLYSSIDLTEAGTDTVAQTIEGSNTVYGQIHAVTENLCCICIPTETGLECHVPTQWLDGCHLMISKALDLPASKIDVCCLRVGGGFGLKISRSSHLAVCCCMASHMLNRPCRYVMDVTTACKAFGKRTPCHADYKADVNESGVIQSIDYTVYEDNGFMNDELLSHFGTDVYSNCYNAARWNYKVYDVYTDTAKNTWCRAPGTLETIAQTEHIMETVSYTLNLDPIDVRLANLDETNHGRIKEMVEEMKETACYVERKAAVEKFNSENHLRKRGLGFCPVKWTPYGYSILNVSVGICHGDGSVICTHGGVEMGQGINTKAMQVIASMLNISMDSIQIKCNTTTTTPNCFATGGSYGSQNVCVGVVRCCEKILERLEATRTSLGDPTWLELIQAAYNANICLQSYDYVGATDMWSYHVYGTCLTETEIDVLTGQSELLRADICQDAGCSVNPEIDIGQVEGAFVMGLGYWTCEDIKYNPTTGAILTTRLWNYPLPQVRDIPQIFNVSLLKNSYSYSAILGAKGIGEPPICLSVAVAFALRACIVAIRKDFGIPSTTWFSIDGPLTTEKICMNSSLDTKTFLYN